MLSYFAQSQYTTIVRFTRHQAIDPSLYYFIQFRKGELGNRLASASTSSTLGFPSLHWSQAGVIVTLPWAVLNLH